MAPSKNGFFGDFTGRVGNIIVYKMNGKTVMRARPSRVKKNPTALQQQSRNDFAHVLKYMQTLKKTINTGFQDVSTDRSAFHTAMSGNLRAYLESGRLAGSEWLIVSKGKRAGAKEVQIEATGGNSFKITWGTPEAGKKWSDHDRVNLVTVKTTGTKIYSTLNRTALRMNGETVIEVNDVATGDEIHFFIFFDDADGSLHRHHPQNVSDSIWIGKATQP
ncbi:MAG: hypothetical protein EOM06_09330 [Sphingobacteriia bacterium]|nr:hypothetical protein [Sphingobacteriia bacterium]